MSYTRVLENPPEERSPIPEEHAHVEANNSTRYMRVTRHIKVMSDLMPLASLYRTGKLNVEKRKNPKSTIKVLAGLASLLAGLAAILHAGEPYIPLILRLL